MADQASDPASQPVIVPAVVDIRNVALSLIAVGLFIAALSGLAYALQGQQWRFCSLAPLR